MNDLETIFYNNKGNVIHKWDHYFEIYHQWFNSYRDKPVNILEIGVYQGGSLKMWREYFGEKARIFAIDVNPDCKQFEDENIEIFIGSQSDRDFLEDVKARIPKLDILIDDGGHVMDQQILSFEVLYGHIKSGGLYLCEDLHTSYWANYGGGYKNRKSFIEYSKNLVDSLNAWYSRENFFQVDSVTRSTYGLHFYPGVLVVEKKDMISPNSVRTGNFVIPDKNFPVPKIRTGLLRRAYIKIRSILYSIQNT